MIKKLTIIFIIFSIIAACKEKQSNFSALEAYCKQQSIDLAGDTSIFLFIPSNQCQNCTRLSAEEIPEQLEDKVILVSGFPPSNFEGFKYYYFDSTNEMYGLPFLEYRNKIVLVVNSKITLIQNMNNLSAQINDSLF